MPYYAIGLFMGNGPPNGAPRAPERRFMLSRRQFGSSVFARYINWRRNGAEQPRQLDIGGKFTLTQYQALDNQETKITPSCMPARIDARSW
jgi:hypothetical protein